MHRTLIPLRIPAGWAIIFNNFVSLPDYEQLTLQDVDSYLSDDLLSIEQLQLTGHRWEVDPAGILIDLSWSEPGQINGEYVLRIVKGTWEGETATFQHRNADRILKAIELTLSRTSPDQTISELALLFQELKSEKN